MAAEPTTNPGWRLQDCTKKHSIIIYMNTIYVTQNILYLSRDLRLGRLHSNRIFESNLFNSKEY